MSYGAIVSDVLITLRQWLQSANLKPGERVPSERQLMAQFGFTHNAVNRAMTRLIAEGVVRREGYKLYYGVEKAGEVRLACDLVLARRSLFIRGYRKAAKALGIDLRLHYYESVEESVTHLRRLNARGTEGVLFDPSHTLSSAYWAGAMGQLLAHDIPAISIGQYTEEVFCVVGDYARAVRLVVSHLTQLGHNELALFTIPPRASTSIEIHDAWKALPWEREGRGSAKRVAFYEDAREDVQILAQRLAGEWKHVTAVVVHSVYEPVVPHLIEELAKFKKQVPRNLSIIALGDLPHLSMSLPPVSAATFDFPLMHETAFRLLQRLIREKQRTGLLAPVACVGVYPGLVLRESVRTLPNGIAWKNDEASADGSPAVDSRQELKAMLRRPYPRTLTATPERFVPVDLVPFVNRSLNYRKGWFGDLPLTHFGPGKHQIHGVPFNVLGGAGQGDKGVIIFRSRTNERGNARELPQQVRIPINSKAGAVYILHACGYTRFLSRFATYTFFSGRKKLGEVELVALGRPRYDWNSAQFEKDIKKANIQDWWGDFPHVDFPGTKQVPIVPPDDETKMNRYAYLYTLEWRNPLPGRTITHMEIQVDPDQSTTLGVLAVSALK